MSLVNGCCCAGFNGDGSRAQRRSPRAAHPLPRSPTGAVRREPFGNRRLLIGSRARRTGRGERDDRSGRHRDLLHRRVTEKPATRRLGEVGSRAMAARGRWPDRDARRDSNGRCATPGGRDARRPRDAGASTGVRSPRHEEALRRRRGRRRPQRAWWWAAAYLARGGKSVLAGERSGMMAEAPTPRRVDVGPSRVSTPGCRGTITRQPLAGSVVDESGCAILGAAKPGSSYTLCRAQIAACWSAESRRRARRWGAASTPGRRFNDRCRQVVAGRVPKRLERWCEPARRLGGWWWATTRSGGAVRAPDRRGDRECISTTEPLSGIVP